MTISTMEAIIVHCNITVKLMPKRTKSSNDTAVSKHFRKKIPLYASSSSRDMTTKVVRMDTNTRVTPIIHFHTFHGANAINNPATRVKPEITANTTR